MELFQQGREEELCALLGTVLGNPIQCKDCWDEGWDGRSSKEMQLS